MITLPTQPGLQRRLAYGNYVRQRNQRISNRWTFDPPTVPYSFSHDSVQENITINFNFEEGPGIGLISKALLNNSQIILNNKKLDSCSVCLQKNLESPLRILSCAHYFHINCIDTWFTKNKSCPVCRKSFTTPASTSPCSSTYNIYADAAGRYDQYYRPLQSNPNRV